MKKAAIINFGGGNLFSVSQACRAADLEPVITQDPKDINDADMLFLPGVGAFQRAMHLLQERGLDEAIVKNVEKGKYLIGICLGMQMMTTQSEEFGQTKGLNLIPGQVRYFKGMIDAQAKIPHTGWSNVSQAKQGSIMDGAEGKDYYFIHSLFVNTENPDHTVAKCNYHDVTFSAVIEYENIIGFQFHPERSGQNGLDLYQKIIERAV